MLGMSLLACIALLVFADVIRARTSFDFVVPLIIYVLLFMNLTHLETYFVATKRPKNVFYYSTIRVAVRLTAVIGTAYYTRSVDAILNALIAVEAGRIIVVIFLSRRLELLSFGFDHKVVQQQLRFIVPLGMAGSLHVLNQYIGQIIISTQLGVVALAIYAIGSYKLPVIRLTRGAISDAIFPDMVREASTSNSDRLRLWKRGNIAYSFLVLPIFLLLYWYADILIPFVFTDKYVEAVPVFRILVLLMPIQCIELSSPLRAANQTGSLLIGNLLMVGTNLICIFLFFGYFEEIALYGPAIGMVLGQLVQHAYMGWRVVDHFEMPVRDLLKWRSQAIIILCIALSWIVLYIGEFIPARELIRVPVFSSLFAVVYFLLIRRYRLEEVEKVIETFGRKLITRAT